MLEVGEAAVAGGDAVSGGGGGEGEGELFVAEQGGLGEVWGFGGGWGCCWWVAGGGRERCLCRSSWRGGVLVLLHGCVGGICMPRACRTTGGSRMRAVLGVGSRVDVILALLMVAWFIFLETNAVIGSICWPRTGTTRRYSQSFLLTGIRSGPLFSRMSILLLLSNSPHPRHLLDTAHFHLRTETPTPRQQLRLRSRRRGQLQIILPPQLCHTPTQTRIPGRRRRRDRRMARRRARKLTRSGIRMLISRRPRRRIRIHRSTIVAIVQIRRRRLHEVEYVQLRFRNQLVFGTFTLGVGLRQTSITISCYFRRSNVLVAAVVGSLRDGCVAAAGGLIRCSRH